MDILPETFIALSGKVDFVRRITSNEYHSSCPSCHGDIHEDGSYPDRFVMWIASRRGTPFGLCRRCGYKWSPLKEDAQWTAEERAEFALKAELLEQQYFEKKAEELKVLSDKIAEQGLYELYYEQGIKSKRAVEYYNSICIPPSWVEYLQLGYIPEYRVKGSLSSYMSPAYTFPVWSLGARVENIKLRVADPLNSNDRYRNLYKSGCQHLYVPLHEMTHLASKVLVMEGEKKAIAGEIYGCLPSDVQIVGTQSSMPEKRILRMFNDVDVVYLLFDPDAYRKNQNGVIPVLNTAKQVGERKCRIIIPPGDTKADDAIALGWKLLNAYNMAVKAEGFAG